VHVATGRSRAHRGFRPRPDGGSDVAAHVASARLCAAASASKPSPCTASRGDRAPDAFPVRHVADGPHASITTASPGIESKRWTGDRHPIGGIEFAQRRRRHRGVPRSTARLPATGACRCFVERRHPAVEPRRPTRWRDLHHELRPVDGRGTETGPDRDGVVAAGAPVRARRGGKGVEPCWAEVATAGVAATTTRSTHMAIRRAITWPPRPCRAGGPRDVARVVGEHA